MKNIYINPQYTTPDNGDGGIRRVVEAQVKYLPDFGFKVVQDMRNADLTAGHGVMIPIRADLPFISHCHGLYWSEYDWANWAYDVNAQVISGLTQAQAITAPSRWVRDAIVRGMFADPTVIYHGVDADEWAHNKSSENYVLWNKARVDPVSSPNDLYTLADMMPSQIFVTTLGTDEDRQNLKKIGVSSQSILRPVIQEAGVYLATARETFGIGTLEAMASGVPIAGWNYGGQGEIIIQGETGYLAPYGDFTELAKCVEKCFTERDRLSRNCIRDVRSRWGWADKIEQYAALYRVTINDWTQPRPLVSVIVTCHNLAHYLPYALKSIQDSSFADWECVIVDDDSTDDTGEVGKSWVERDERYKYFKTPENLKLSGALNFGVSHSRGRFIIPLDADNELTPSSLLRLSQALLADRTLHGAYGELDIMNHEGRERRKNVGFPTQFNYFAQMAHLNQAQSSTMVRREVLERSGGYRDRMWRAEDAHLWCLVSSMGFRIQKVTEESTMVYRQRSDSKSAWEYKNFDDKDGDWCRDFSWRLASTAQEGAEKLHNKKFLPCVDAIPFGAGGTPTINMGLSWNVHHHASPLVSVIIPVGKGHTKYVIDALDSCLGQSFPNWEAVVINDTGDPWDEVIGAPYARVFPTKGKEGAGVARNLGIKEARGNLLLFLDSDDMLMPRAILEMMKVYGSGEHGYIYSNYVEIRSDHTEKVIDLPNYEQKLWKGQHAITLLIAKQDALKVGGFDPEIKGWEDWDFFVKLAINGICGHRIPLPLFYYRKDTGFRRDESFSREKELLPILKKRYDQYYKGDGVDFMSCCGGNGDVILEVKQALKRAAEMSGIDLYPDLTVLRDEVERDFRLEYIGDKTGAISFLGADGRRIYRGGNNDHDRFIDVHKEYQEDLNKLLGSGEWRIVRNASQ